MQTVAVPWFLGCGGRKWLLAWVKKIGAALATNSKIPVGSLSLTLNLWGPEDSLYCWPSPLSVRTQFSGMKLQSLLFTDIKAQLFETSSKTGQSVDELFQKVAEDYVSVAAFQVMTEDKGVDLGQKANPYFYSCCHH